MASQIDEIRRLREQLARTEAERDQAREDYAKLAGLTQQYIAAKDEQDEGPEHERQLARYQQGWQDAERHVDELTRDGMALDPHGRLRPLEVPKELPETKTLDERIAEIDAWSQCEAQWRYDQHGREQAQRERAEQNRAEKAELHHYRAERAQRQAHPKAADREMAS
jgi:hypothetical protein